MSPESPRAAASARTVRVACAAPYDVRVGAGVLAEVAARAIEHGRVALLADERAAELHLARLGPLASAPLLALPSGEATKSFAALERTLEFLARAGLDRRSCVVVLGGGVAGDLGGLAASLFMRGIALYQCPTTLLAQVDSSIGGKTAVNLAAGKNLAGTFHQPRGVWADVETLATLSAEDFASGLGEVAKTALIAGDAALARLEAAAPGLKRREPEVLVEIVADCAVTKAGVVARDPGEAGERKALNLGHTFAHGIEHAAGYGRVPHGVAVAAGLGLALEYSRRAGILEEPALEERVRTLLGRLDLPCDLGSLRERAGLSLAPAELSAGMRHDKKGAAGRPRLVLVRRAGALALEVEADPELLALVLAG